MYTEDLTCVQKCALLLLLCNPLRTLAITII